MKRAWDAAFGVSLFESSGLPVGSFYSWVWGSEPTFSHERKSFLLVPKVPEFSQKKNSKLWFVLKVF